MAYGNNKESGQREYNKFTATEIRLENSNNGEWEQIIFPMLPEEIHVRTATNFQTYNIMSLGEVRIPYGDELTGFSWSGMLPQKWPDEFSETRYPYINPKFISKLKTPHEIQGLLSTFRVNGTKLKLIVSNTPIEHFVYLESYSFRYRGDLSNFYHYDISFIVARDLELISELTTYSAQPRPEQEPDKTYTVVRGDTLWNIAQKLWSNGARWPEIYNANKGIIGNNPDLIYPGQVYTIPR